MSNVSSNKLIWPTHLAWVHPHCIVSPWNLLYFEVLLQNLKLFIHYLFIQITEYFCWMFQCALMSLFYSAFSDCACIFSKWFMYFSNLNVCLYIVNLYSFGFYCFSWPCCCWGKKVLTRLSQMSQRLFQIVFECHHSFNTRN